MTAPLPLFNRDPLWLTEPATKIERAFAAFHRANPRVYEQLASRAISAYARAEKRVSVADMIEDLRHESFYPFVDYKLNNNFRSLYARLLIHHHPSLAQVIEVRRRRERGAA